MDQLPSCGPETNWTSGGCHSTQVERSRRGVRAYSITSAMQFSSGTTPPLASVAADKYLQDTTATLDTYNRLLQ